MDVTDLIPRELHPMLAWLGRIPNWISFRPTLEAAPSLPRTSVVLDYAALDRAPDNPNKRWILGRVGPPGTMTAEKMNEIAYLEMASRFIADGPKLFRPTEEQFESFMHVELRMSPAEFRSPYPALMVGVPTACRHTVAREYGVDVRDVPTMVLVRHAVRSETDATIMSVCRLPQTAMEEFHLFTQHPLNPTIESALRRVVGHGPGGRQTVLTEDDIPEAERREKVMTRVLVRAAMNCCLMLTHYGHREGGPLDPVAWRKHRAKKHLAHLRHGDFETVLMTQDITIRVTQPPTANPPGDGTGIELRPHWRKGHWRAYPGRGADRAAGQKVPLAFIRPCLVRPDRVKGDLSQSSATYHGA